MTRTYAWYNGVPLVKFWDGDICVQAEPVLLDEIQQHNGSPVSCFGSLDGRIDPVCWNCVELDKNRRRRAAQGLDT